MTLYFVISTDQKTQISQSKIKNKTMKKNLKIIVVLPRKIDGRWKMMNLLLLLIKVFRRQKNNSKSAYGQLFLTLCHIYFE